MALVSSGQYSKILTGSGHTSILSLGYVNPSLTSRQYKNFAVSYFLKNYVDFKAGIVYAYRTILV